MNTHSFLSPPLFLRGENEISKKIGRGVIFENICHGYQNWMGEKVQKS